MKETYLHQLFLQKSLGNIFVTTGNKVLQVLDFGRHNTNSGPDFLEAKIRLGDELWAGHIEFHVNASDWYRHGHENDPGYNNVIAHFVYNYDCDVNSGEYLLPTIELKELIRDEQLDHIRIKLRNKNRLICEKSLLDIDESVISSQIRQVLISRLDRKARKILDEIHSNKGDKVRVFYQTMARAFGGKVNSEPFERLVLGINFSDFRRLNASPLKYEALVLGMSGLLPDKSENDYVQSLISEHTFLKHLLSLPQMNAVEWKYSSMRPFSFPDIRLAQFAHLLSKGIRLSDMSDPDADPNQLFQLLDINLHPFWDTHYRLQNYTKNKSSNLSASFKNHLLINVLFPFAYALGKYQRNNTICYEILQKYRLLKPENNSVVNQWKKLGVKVNSAFESQALIELKTNYCNEKKCLICSIGKEVLKS